MGRPASSFSRKKPKYKPEAKVLVICEDVKSCRVYLQDAAIYFRSNAVVEVTHCGNTDPLGIVKDAIKRKKHHEEVYCAVDRDTHDNFEAAIKLAEQNKIKMIVSYPCYEFWLLLHFHLNRKPYAATGGASACDNLISDLCRKPGMKGYTKGGSEGLFNQLIGKLPRAIKNSEKVLIQATEDGELNPSSRLHELIRKFEGLGAPTSNK